MPLQNRVDPWGSLIATNARGTLLGNRGILHNDKKEIVSFSKRPAWVTCQLSFKGWKREIFSPGNYSELFFLDEATAFSAGHRPCGMCRRERFNEFKVVWQTANLASDQEQSIAEIDKQMHAERVIRGGKKVTYTAEFKSLPDGTFIEHQGQAYLCWQGALKQWSPEGYSETDVFPDLDEMVTVLTPHSIVKMYSNGFVPQIQGEE